MDRAAPTNGPAFGRARRAIAAISGRTGARQDACKPLGVGQPLPQSTVPAAEGTLHLGERLGRGSAGEVWVAWLERPGRILKRVAVRVLAPMDGAEPERLEAAARAAALVRHPNVVDVHELAAQPDGVTYLVGEMVDGMSLAALLAAYRAAHRRLPLELVLFTAIEVAEGLAAAQSARSPEGRMIGLSHGQLSPRSVLLSYHGEVKVEGFGLGDVAGAGSGVRARLAARLSPTAPEMVRGHAPDARSDVFGLGVLLSEMLIGPRFPARVTDEEACVMARDGFVCPDVLAPPLPPGVQSVVDRALSVERKRRQAHAGIVAHDLRAVALAMGVGDARFHLRSALFEMSEQAPGSTVED